MFGTNPVGLEYDGQLTNAGQGSGGTGSGLVRRSGSQQQRGSGGGFNLNWDGVWEVRARISDIGWTAEIAIPFRTLRYPSGAAQTWGLNFQRNIRHRNEESYWASLPRQFDLNRLSLAGEVQGVEVPVQRNLKLTPYVLGEAIRRDAHAYNVTASYESQRYRYGGGFTEVGPAFNPEVGFYARRGYRRVDGAFRSAFRPENSVGFHEWTPHASFFTVWNFDTGQTESEWIHLDNTMEWRNGLWMSTALNVTIEGVLEPFEISPGVIVPVDRYDHAEAQLRFRTDQGAPSASSSSRCSGDSSAAGGHS